MNTSEYVSQIASLYAGSYLDFPEKLKGVFSEENIKYFTNIFHSLSVRQFTWLYLYGLSSHRHTNCIFSEMRFLLDSTFSHLVVRKMFIFSPFIHGKYVNAGKLCNSFLLFIQDKPVLNSISKVLITPQKRELCQTEKVAGFPLQISMQQSVLTCEVIFQNS